MTKHLTTLEGSTMSTFLRRKESAKALFPLENLSEYRAWNNKVIASEYYNKAETTRRLVYLVDPERGTLTPCALIEVLRTAKKRYNKTPGRKPEDDPFRKVKQPGPAKKTGRKRKPSRKKPKVLIPGREMVEDFVNAERVRTATLAFETARKTGVTVLDLLSGDPEIDKRFEELSAQEIAEAAVKNKQGGKHDTN